MSSTSLTVAPGTAVRTRLASARSITIASPTRLVVTRWLSRVVGGFGPPAVASHAARRAGRGRSSIGTEWVRKHAARNGDWAALAAVIASSVSGSGVASGCHVSTTGGRPSGSRSWRAFISSIPAMPSIAQWWILISMANPPGS